MSGRLLRAVHLHSRGPHAEDRIGLHSDLILAWIANPWPFNGSTTSSDCGPCKGRVPAATARAVIQRIEAAQMIPKGQVLGITRQNLHGQAWVFVALLQVA